MILSDETKKAIHNEYSDWEHLQYGKYKDDKDWHQKMGAFYTPPELTIKMIEKFPSTDGTVLDPACGCGGLLAGMIIAGADPKKCYGIELDPVILEICRERLGKLGVPKYNIHLGNALNEDCYDNFNEDYEYDTETNTVIMRSIT